MRTLRALVALGLGIAVLMALPRPAVAATSTTSITDPTGDSSQTADPRADITSASINYWRDAITVTVNVAQWTDPSTDPGWRNYGSTVVWEFDTDSDGVADHAAMLQPNGSGGLYGFAGAYSNRTYMGSYFRMQCNVEGAAVSPGYRLSMPAGCIGSPSTVAFAADFSYGDGHGQTFASDRAPDTGFSTSVSPSTQVSSRGGLVADDWGGIHPYNTDAVSPPSITDPPPYWPGQDVVRGTAATFGAGYVLDDWGGIHRYSAGTGSSLAALFGPYWPGEDVARGIALMPDGGGGYVLDDWGGLHSFALTDGTRPPDPEGGGYWPGKDVARGVVILPDGSGGYVVDSWGAFHPFVIPGPGHVMPPKPTDGPYWPGQDVVRGAVADAEGNGGYVVDDWGAIHTFSVPGTPGSVPAISGGPYWPGNDVARGISVVPQDPPPAG